MDLEKRFIGKVVLFWCGQRLPTDFFMDYRKDHFVFIAETDVPDQKNGKVVSYADKLIDLLESHRQNLGRLWPDVEANGMQAPEFIQTPTQ